MEEEEKISPNFDPMIDDIYQKQRDLRLKSRNLARRIESIRASCVEKFVFDQFESEKAKTIESARNFGDSAEKIALIENRLSINQLEEKIDRLFNEKNFSKQNFRSKFLRRQSSRNLASIIKKYGRTKLKFQNLTGKLVHQSPPDDHFDFAPKNNRPILKIYDRRLARDEKLDSDATDYEDLVSSSSDDETKNDNIEWLAEKSYLKSRKFYLQSQMHKIDTSILQLAEFYKRIKMTKMSKFDEQVEEQEESCARIREFKPKLRTRLIDLQSRKKNLTCGNCYPPFSACLNCVFSTNHVLATCQDHDYVNLETALYIEFGENFHNGEELINQEISTLLKEPKTKFKQDSISTEPIPKLLPTKKPILKRRTLSSSSSSSSSSTSSSSSAAETSKTSTFSSVGGDVYDFVDDDDPDWSASDNDDANVKKTRRRRSSAAKINKSARVCRGRKPKGGKIAGKLTTGQKRSKVNNSTYDIDNIVIDSSVAAASRIEILQYKEIDTPGWRQKIIDECKENSSESAKLDEQIDDQTFLLRHQEPECKEHEMFQRVQANIFSGTQRKSVTLHSSVNPAEEKPKNLTTIPTDDVAAL